MKCSDYFLEASDIFIAKEAANWWNQFENTRVHQDKRSDSSCKKNIIPEKYKEVAIDVISKCLCKGIPVTTSKIKKALMDADPSLNLVWRHFTAKGRLHLHRLTIWSTYALSRFQIASKLLPIRVQLAPLSMLNYWNRVKGAW